MSYLKKNYILEATHEGKLDINGVYTPCAVLENGARIINSKALFTPFNTTRHGRVAMSGLPAILGGKNLETFITPEIAELAKPIPYRKKGQVRIYQGYDAALIPIVCIVYRDAWRANKLTNTQIENRAKPAEKILDSLAIVGITALVDEATGYEFDKEKNGLQKILQHYISSQLLNHQRRFPLEYYEEIYRLYNWDLDPKNHKRPQVIGSFTNKYVYSFLPEEVHHFIKKKAIQESKNENQYKVRYYRFLSKENGIKELDAQIDVILTIMRLSNDIDDFREKFVKARALFK